MADYELVSKITGFSIYIENNYSTAVNSGYTLASPFVCRINLQAGVSPAEVLNSCTLFWHFGDGFIEQIKEVRESSIQSTAHKFNWPGMYEIKLSVTSNDSVSSATFSKALSVNNYLTDSLEWDYTGWSDLSSTNRAAGAIFHGFQNCKPGSLNTPIPLTFRFTSSSTLSDRIVFDLYSQNSSSQPYDSATQNNKYANLRPRWRFTDLNNNVINTAGPLSAQIQEVVIDSLGRAVTATGFDSSTSVIVGYIGSVDVYYIDDIPSLTYSSGSYSISVPTLWVVSNTNSLPNKQDKNDLEQPSYSNSVISLTSQFYVKNLSADYFNLTVNGGAIPLSGVMWPGVSGNFIISTNSALSSSTLEVDYSNKTLLNYPIPYSNSPIIIYPSIPTTFTFANSSFNLSRTDAIGRDTGGFYRNTFYSLDSTSSLLTAGAFTASIVVSALSATVINEPPANALSGYNPSTRIAAATANNTLVVKNLTGTAQFTITNFDKTYFVRKINEDFNYGAQLLTYALQPTIASNTNMFAFLSAMAGDSYTTEDSFGTKAYEKIANFVANTQDIHTSNVDYIYSLANSIDSEFDSYNLTPPPTLKRAFDLFSVPHNRLWGTREKYNINFNNQSDHTNLGTSLTAYNINTAIVSSGQLIVLNDLFVSNFYELLEVPKVNSYASVTALDPNNTYFTSSLTYPVTSYPLSAFFGWGVKTPVANYYRFWVYKPGFNNIPVNNTIDWSTKTDGVSTTLVESNSSVSEWYKDSGILENIYSYYLYKGLDLLK